MKSSKTLLQIARESVRLHEVEFGRVLNSLYPYNKLADVVLPISGALDEGFWFRIQDEFHIQTTNLQISQKTYKVELELYVSFHGDNEFWYKNPSNSYVETNHLATGGAHGAYREVLVTLNGQLVGSVIPFPVIFTDGINPLFWEPVVSIGALDLPTYDINLTPLLDVNTETVKYEVSSIEIQCKSEFVLLGGEFEVEGERSSQATARVNSSFGDLKTQFTEKTKFKSKLKFKSEGNKKELDPQINSYTVFNVTL
ncbi:unnamed protein product [Lactuca saligna]|uniref:Peptide N-acetyl-beta-D-glucosaminyl asparaginase amidase A N-terminal domain-containing protein n=1 Tax=Lactuca saligna TaxID=75948 RepID=A0AA36EHS8_LACSI|nr:unnamed protein product [Lactuca saligna]